MMVAALVMSVPAFSDMNFGSTARAMALGGAGLALGDEEAAAAAVMNPALAAVEGSKRRIIVPGLDFHATGASVGKLPEHISRLTNGTPDGALALADSFAANDTRLSVTSVAGFSGDWGLTIEAEAVGLISPGPEARKWAAAALGFKNNLINFNPQHFQAILANTNLTNAVTNWYAPVGGGRDKAAAEAAFSSYMVDLGGNKVSVGAVYALPSITYNKAHKLLNGTMWVGSNLKIIHTESRLWTISPKVNNYNYDSTSGELKGVDLGFTAVPGESQSAMTMKADVGAIYRSKDSHVQYGIVVNNFLKPRISGVTNPQDNLMISMGAAGDFPEQGITIAADLVNLTRSNTQPAQFRVGAEWRLQQMLALRAGYNHQGLTWGLNLLGVNLAFGSNTPALISQVMKM